MFLRREAYGIGRSGDALGYEAWTDALGGVQGAVPVWSGQRGTPPFP